jgi:hypothetical protein
MQAGFTASPTAWLVQSAQPMSEQSIQSPLDFLVQTNPAQSGYGDGTATGASMAEMADLSTLFNGIDATSLFVTRLLAKMPASGLSKDMTLGASSSQAIVPQVLQATQYVNGPTCACTGAANGVTTGGGAPGSSNAVTAGAGGAPVSTGGGKGGGGPVSSSSACSLGGSGDASLAAYGLLAGLAWVARRRRVR